MSRIAALALVITAVAPAAAAAAPPSGPYVGVSSGKYIQVGQAEEPTDKGKVTFKVKGSRVKDFRLRKQLMQCGPPAEVPVTVETIRLNARGKGSAIYKDPDVGRLKVTIKITNAGKATGTIRKPPKATGLCDSDFPVSFAAKPS